MMLVSCVLYESYKRSCLKALYGIESPHVLRCLETPVFSMINILTYMTPEYILAAFGGLRKNRQYEVAAKMLQVSVRMS
jgi:hypothetical protein